MKLSDNIKRRLYAATMIANIRETVGYNKVFSAHGFNVSNWSNTHTNIIDSGVADPTGGEFNFEPAYKIFRDEATCKEFFLAKSPQSEDFLDQIIQDLFWNTAHRADGGSLPTSIDSFEIENRDHEILEVFVVANYAVKHGTKYIWTNRMDVVLNKAGFKRESFRHENLE